MSDLRIRMSCLLEFAQRSKEVCWMRISVNRDSHFNKSRTSISLSRGQRVRSNSACLVSVRDD